MVASRALAICHNSTNAATETPLVASARPRGEIGHGISTGRRRTLLLTNLGRTVLLDDEE
jgi:hypothetical protein